MGALGFKHVVVQRCDALSLPVPIRLWSAVVDLLSYRSHLCASVLIILVTMVTSGNKDDQKLQEEDIFASRLKELEEEKAKQEAILAKSTADVEALRAYKDMLEALLKATVGTEPALAA